MSSLRGPATRTNRISINNGSQCSILHNISKYEGSNKHTQLPTEHLDQCLFFTCSKNETLCDNVLPTDYDGPHPPCCSHILRDMARAFDEEMCRLGLDYTVGFGTLLGLERGNKFIPWTIDHDYIIESTMLADAMVDLWDAKVTGMAHVYHGGMNRMCITPDFANGRLSFWTNKFFSGSTISQSDRLWKRNHQYIDIYMGKNIYQSVFQEVRPCKHYYSDVFPTKRRLVYEGTFYQNFPAKPEQMLRVYYGKNWRIPNDNKNPHGYNEIGGSCPKRFQISSNFSMNSDEFQSVVAEQEATLYQWKNMAHDMANTLSNSSSCGSVPTPQNPFVFFHIRKAAGSNLRSIIDRKTQDLNLPQWIPCKNGVPCVPSSLPPPGEDGNAKAVYAGHVNYNHMSQLFRQRFAKTPTFAGTDLRIMETQNFRDSSTGRKRNHTYISLWHDNLHNSNFGSCLINIRPTVNRVISCWNYRFIREVKQKLDFPLASNATVEEFMAMLPEAVDKFGNGCNNEIARILGRTNDENLINHLSVRTYGLKYFLDEMETVMSRIASCVVIRMDRCEDSNAILKHFLPWMHSEDLCKSSEKQSSFSGVVSDEVREVILAQNSFDELVFQFGEEMFEALLEVARWPGE